MGTAEMSLVTREDIAFAVKSLGVVEGDIIVVHSSLSSLGCVDGGADTLIDAFIEVLGPNGTMIMPTLCQRDKERRFETWDIAKSPSDVGKTTEAFRLRPQSLRSNHPTHSVAAAGRLAAEIVSGHPSDYGRTGPWGDAAFAKGSPWQKIYDLNAGIVMVGVDLKANTMVHFIEHLIVERALAQASTDKRGAMFDLLAGWNTPGIWPSFDRIKLQQELDNLGLISRQPCGSATLLMVRARAMVDNAVKMMEAAPQVWFGDAFCAWAKSSNG